MTTVMIRVDDSLLRKYVERWTGTDLDRRLGAAAEDGAKLLQKMAKDRAHKITGRMADEIVITTGATPDGHPYRVVDAQAEYSMFEEMRGLPPAPWTPESVAGGEHAFMAPSVLDIDDKLADIFSKHLGLS